jgi:MFS superfamily sulfate permease-like transporter
MQEYAELYYLAKSKNLTKPLNKNRMDQTVVEWLEEQIYLYGINPHQSLFEQAKEMEKAEKIKAQIYICDRIRYWKDNQINSVENLQINLEKQLKELLLTFKLK